MHRSDLVRDLRNKASKDCHNPFCTELHMKTENKLKHGDISGQIAKDGKTDNTYRRNHSDNQVSSAKRT